MKILKEFSFLKQQNNRKKTIKVAFSKSSFILFLLFFFLYYQTTAEKEKRKSYLIDEHLFICFFSVDALPNSQPVTTMQYCWIRSQGKGNIHLNPVIMLSCVISITDQTREKNFVEAKSSTLDISLIAKKPAFCKTGFFCLVCYTENNITSP